MTLDTAGPPFVLLDDARVDGAAPARLYRDPVETIVAHAQSGVAACLDRLRERGALHAAGYVAYDAGALAEAPGDVASGAPLLWFGLFDRHEEIAPADVPGLLPDPDGAWCSAPRPAITRDAYVAAFDRVKAHIAAGDIYQANLTFQAGLRVAGDPLALYARLRARAAAGWGGIVHDGTRLILSFSPELFFRLDGEVLTARPMKGTARRLSDARADALAAEGLAADEKQRAENLMIVDLLRNDLSRVAAPASVAVPALFEVESYPTVHQMTSTVSARLAEGADAVSVLEACFPCGSITGAPKLKAMAVAADVEAGSRGLYTGAIGRVDAGGDSAFDVAIRTLVLEGEGRATIGLGSGIVADSNGAAEWRECLDKAAFLRCPGFDLIETMRFDPLDGIPDLERHLARLKASAEAFDFAIDRHALRNELQAATFRLREPARVRLRAAPSGRAAIEVRPLPAPPAAPVTVAVVPLPVSPSDYRLRHKTADRGFYDRARAAAGTFEVVFARQDGLLTEGSFTSLFVARDGRLLTPPLSRGLLPGVLRQRLIEEGRAIETDLTADDLRAGFLLGNALRGLIEARLPPNAT
ncbi:aminodeoxychorismate synthase component I [Sphingomonas sp.]|uniref:aminodeoxychorismate synthase component I n=1 Tax=Sphingomonas sp. TaxID=28214 RepID=UPI003B007BEF